MNYYYIYNSFLNLIKMIIKYYNNNKISKIIKIIIILIGIFILIFLLNLYSYKNNKNNTIFNNKIDDLKEIQNFINININGNLINPNEILHNINYPKISVIITVYNGQGYLKPALRSIQNQDFKDIEIIIIDDCSKDDSLNLIRNLKKEDPRIRLIQNKKNKGILYSKTKGILNAKGKYLLILDMDDIYTAKDAFSTLYEEAERNNLDILGFASICNKDANIMDKHLRIVFNLETPIIYQPNVSEWMYFHDENGQVIRRGGILWCYFFKTKLFIKVIKRIKKKFLIRKINIKEDLMFFFILTRTAKNIKQIKRIFHFYFTKHESNDPKIIYSNKEKSKRRKYDCLGNLSYIEFLLTYTKNNIYDKEIASTELKNFVLSYPCRNNTLMRKDSFKICKLFLKNKYININIKKDIILFLNEFKNKNR